MQSNENSGGSLSILNVYEGDVKITFDKDNPAETIRAKRIVSDMLRRGYALLIEVEGAYQRAIGFDEKVGEYIIADFDPTYAGTPRVQIKASSEEPTDVSQEPSQEEEIEASEPSSKKRGRPRRIAMESTAAVAIGRTAGG